MNLRLNGCRVIVTGGSKGTRMVTFLADTQASNLVGASIDISGGMGKYL
jgi:hypothetical protein